ncbi:MAG TPA: Lrp/AsnC family transcriptional regulator [Lysobacter sp.]
MQHTLDGIDIALVRLLQEQGRLTNAELAERVALSPSACLRRVQRLEQAGLIRGYRAVVDPRQIGLGLEAFVGVQLVRKDRAAIDQFNAAVTQWEQVVACYILTGNIDFMLHVVTVDFDAYSDFVVDRLLTTSAVANINSSIVLRTVKQHSGLPTGHLSD